MSKELSTRVKEICAEKGLQLKELAAIMNVKPESLSRALNGNPQLSSLKNVAKALGIGVSDLFSDNSEDCIVSASATNNSLRSIIVYKGKTYIADSMAELLSHVRMISDL